jgi:hypothetical protein
VGIVAVQQYTQNLLNNLVLPLELGTLAAFILPYNPGDGSQAGAYVWGSRGDETRRAIPRAQPADLPSGAWKVTDHDLDVWLIWIGSSEDPNAGMQFPAIIDTVLATLRNTALLDQQNKLIDPVTGSASWLIDYGERLSHEYSPVRAVVDQRLLRYDARITVSAEEWFQA